MNLLPCGKHLCLVIVAAVVASCSSPTPDVNALIESARQNYADFEFVSARDGFAEALEKDPNDERQLKVPGGDKVFPVFGGVYGAV